MSTETVNAGETLASFARRHGFTRQRAHALKKRGLPLLEDGSVNSDEADQWLENNLDHHRREAQQQANNGSARERKEAADASLKELELRRRRGQLLERAAVERYVFELARGERDAWQTFAAHAAPQLASRLGVAEADAFEALDGLVREHLDQLSDVTLEDLK